MLGYPRHATTTARATREFMPWPDGLEDRVVLSTFKVNTTLDTVAVSLKTGKDATGHISLRSAIQAANAKPNSDTIILPKGTFTLTIPGANEDLDATGDLDINGNLTIKGKNANSTIIDGNNLDRVIQVLSGKVQISGVTIEHGRAFEGGGILNSGGKVTLTSVVVANNVAIGNAGANGVTGVGGGTVGERRERRWQRRHFVWRRDRESNRLAEYLEEHDRIKPGDWRQWRPGRRWRIRPGNGQRRRQ